MGKGTNYLWNGWPPLRAVGVVPVQAMPHAKTTPHIDVATCDRGGTTLATAYARGSWSLMHEAV
ncbi:hypothetical protein BHE74_00048453, partial [Ensete ventricosum]